MEHSTDLKVHDLQNHLQSTYEKTPVLRLLAAITYSNRITQSDLAEWFDVERKTIYNLLNRQEEWNLKLAITDKQWTRRT